MRLIATGSFPTDSLEWRGTRHLVVRYIHILPQPGQELPDEVNCPGDLKIRVSYERF